MLLTKLNFTQVYFLLFWYHISKNLREKYNLDVKVKYLKCKDERKIKQTKVWKILMDAWQTISEPNLEETYL